MADRVDQLIARSRMGDIKLSQGEKMELQNALYGLAPSSSRYKSILAILGKPRESSYRSPDQNEDGTWRNVNEPTFRGPPTLDFLSHKPDGLDNPYGAKGHDAAGSVTSRKPEENPNVTRSGENWFNFEGGGGAVANDVLRQGGLPNTLAGEYDEGDKYLDVPEGYSFSGMSPGGITQTRNDPRVLAALLARDAGGAAGTEAYLAPYIQSADALATMGVLGGPVTDDTVFGGAAMSDMSGMTLIEDMTDFVNQPGNQVFNPAELYGRSFDRLENTDFSDYSTPNGEAYSYDDIIEMTNVSLMAMAPFVAEDGQAVLSAKLARAGIEYKMAMATGEIGNISYPAYLKSIGADQWMG